jgi:hypothetical protein
MDGRGQAGSAHHLRITVDTDYLKTTWAAPPFKAMARAVQPHEGAALVAQLMPQRRGEAGPGLVDDGHRVTSMGAAAVASYRQDAVAAGWAEVPNGPPHVGPETDRAGTFTYTAASG